MFIIHGLDNGTILPRVAEALHDAAGEPKEDLWLIPGAEHARGKDIVPEEYGRLGDRGAAELQAQPSV